MSHATDAARLTADLAKTTCPDAAQRIRRELVEMGAARERVANITLAQHGGAVVTERFTIFDNPYDLDQLRLVKEVKRVTVGARVLHWGWAN